MAEVTGSVQPKDGRWHAVMNVTNENGERVKKWKSLRLDVQKGTKREAERRLKELLAKMNAGESYLTDTMTHAERERYRLAHTRVEDYLLEWLEGHKHEVKEKTCEDYKAYIDKRMVPFFEKLNIMVKDLTGDEINEFYAYLRNDGLSGTSAQRYHSVLHIAFRDAVKRRIIPANPVDQATRPKREQFIAGYYNVDEIKQLLELTKDDEIYLIILITAYYGLRRSEVLGLRWSAVDFTAGTVTINHTVHPSEDGPVGEDRLKTESSYRTLPLLPVIRDALIRHREQQEEYRKIMRSAYRKDYSEYICLDALGRLYDPDFVTNHFKTLLKKHKLKQIRFHDLRHSCASLLVAQGVSMKLIQEWLGHSDMATTANIYSHVDSASKMATGNVIGEVLG